MRRKNPAVALATRRSPKPRPKLSARRRSEIARHAARARWAKRKPTAYVPGVPDIWEIAEQLTRDIPPEAWASLPRDLSDQIDHYVYGTPKR